MAIKLQGRRKNSSRSGFFYFMLYVRKCSFFMEKFIDKMVQVGKDQEKAQSEKDSHSKNRGGKKTNNQVLIP